MNYFILFQKIQNICYIFSKLKLMYKMSILHNLLTHLHDKAMPIHVESMELNRLVVYSLLPSD